MTLDLICFTYIYNIFNNINCTKHDSVIETQQNYI